MRKNSIISGSCILQIKIRTLKFGFFKCYMEWVWIIAIMSSFKISLIDWLIESRMVIMIAHTLSEDHRLGVPFNLYQIRFL